MLIKIINRFTCRELQLKKIINELSKNNMYPILDYINENGKNHYNNYKKMMNIIPLYQNNLFSVKMSSLDIQNNFDISSRYINDICENAIQNNCKILIDAENYHIQGMINNISNELMYKYNINEVNIYKTYQCYRKDSFEIINNDLHDSKNKHFNLGVKLVRGAYYNSDFKYNILYNNIQDTHNNYNTSIEYLFKNSNENDRIILATHNEKSCDFALENKNILKNKNMLSFAQLMGMGNNLSNKLSKTNIVYKYVPFGNFCESIPYLLRRLYENKDSIKYLIK